MIAFLLLAALAAADTIPAGPVTDAAAVRAERRARTDAEQLAKALRTVAAGRLAADRWRQDSRRVVGQVLEWPGSPMAPTLARWRYPAEAQTVARLTAAGAVPHSPPPSANGLLAMRRNADLARARLDDTPAAVVYQTIEGTGGPPQVYIKKLEAWATAEAAVQFAEGKR